MGDRNSEVAVLRLDGDLDLVRAAQVQRAIGRAERRQPPVLVLDLRGATFVDSTMLRIIVSAHRRASRDGRRLAVAVDSDVVRRVFRITLLEWRLEIVDDPADVELPDRRGRRDHDVRNGR